MKFGSIPLGKASNLQQVEILISSFLRIFPTHHFAMQSNLHVYLAPSANIALVADVNCSPDDNFSLLSK